MFSVWRKKPVQFATASYYGFSAYQLSRLIMTSVHSVKMLIKAYSLCQTHHLITPASHCITSVL